LLINRKSGLDRLDEFIKSGLADYAERRNTDLGPDRHREIVSMLSPYLSRRLIIESECIQAALDVFPANSVGKWIDEVIWRIYWRGWLDHNSSVWIDYLSALDHLQRSGGRDDPRYLNAINGLSGIECFDAWAEELKTTGYLHNHARMWFASIWIYTLRLPWQLGAEFFLSHLLDGDPAVNTLSWRWVAGLHTKGKRYIATRDNIERCTQGRFRVSEKLATQSEADTVEHLCLNPRPEKFRWETPLNSTAVDLTRDSTLIIHGDDLYLEGSELKGAKVSRIIAIDASHASDQNMISPLVADALNQAMKDGANRAQLHYDAPLQWAKPAEMSEHLEKNQQLICMKPNYGYWTRLLRRECEHLDLKCVQRRTDIALFPHATKGFFTFREKAWSQNFGI